MFKNAKRAHNITQTMSAFDSLQSLSSRPVTIRLADPDDIVATEPKWSPAQMLKPLAERGDPEFGHRIQIKPDAPVTEFTVRRLTAAERQRCDAILDAVEPPAITEKRRGPNPGDPPVEVRTGYDFEDAAYMARYRAARTRQTALVVLLGVKGLAESVTGENEEQKIDTVLAALDERLLAILGNEIWNRTYGGGDPADFFTSANSSDTRG